MDFIHKRISVHEGLAFYPDRSRTYALQDFAACSHASLPLPHLSTRRASRVPPHTRSLHIYKSLYCLNKTLYYLISYTQLSEMPIPLHLYETRHRIDNFDLDALDDLLQEAATSSIPSSPTDTYLPTIHDEIPGIRFKDLDPEAMASDEEADPTYCLPEPAAQRPYQGRAPRRTDEEKAIEILRFMKAMFPKFSLRKFLVALFSSEDGAITNWTGIFLADGGAMAIMDLWWAKMRGDAPLESWVIERAAVICRKEIGWLTDNASNGPHFDEAKALRLSPGTITVDLMNSFRLSNLGLRYEGALPHLQHLLKAVIGSDVRTTKYQRDRNLVRLQLCCSMCSAHQAFYFRI